jgi:hypothetical protein
VTGRRRFAVLLALASLCNCSSLQAERPPSWLALQPGTPARLVYSADYDPEHTLLYATPDAARASVKGRVAPSLVRTALAGNVVSIERIDPTRVDGKHIVSVTSKRFNGWIIAEDGLLPIPPIKAPLVIPKRIDHVLQELYTAQEDDDDADGVPLNATSHVTYEGFDPSPGNPEYFVHVDDGPLAGSTGYVTAQELETPQERAFRLAEP